MPITETTEKRFEMDIADFLLLTFRYVSTSKLY